MLCNITILVTTESVFIRL